MNERQRMQQAMAEALGTRALSESDLVSALSGQGFGSRRQVEDRMHQILSRDMTFAPVGDRLVHLPGLAGASSFTVFVDAADAARGFLRVKPGLEPISWWLVEVGIRLVDSDGRSIGDLTTDGIMLDDVDTDVLVGPDGWLDDVAGGWAAFALGGGAVRLVRLDAAPAPTGRQLEAIRAGFESAAVDDVVTLFDGETASLRTTSSETVFRAALLADREAFVDAAIPFLPDLYTAAGLELRDHTVADAGFDWATLDASRARLRLATIYRLADRQIDGVQMIVGAAQSVADEGDAGLGATQDERAGAALLLSAFLGDGDVALAAAAEAGRRGISTEQLADFATALIVNLGDAEPLLYGRGGDEPRPAELNADLEPNTDLPGPYWLLADCCELIGEHRASAALIDLIATPRCEHPPTLIAAAALAADRGDAQKALRLVRQAGVEDEHEDVDGPYADLLPEPDDDVLLLREVEPVARYRPRATAGRNDPCPCGSGRKYKTCHLGREVMPLSERSYWLFEKLKRFARRQSHGSVATDIVEEITDPWSPTGRGLAKSPLIADIAVHEYGFGADFLENRAWLLPEDEQLLAAQWALVDRGVFEKVSERGDEVSLRNVATGDVITVVNTYMAPQVRPGTMLLGRPLPVGDVYRAFGGFVEIPHHLVNPAIDAIASKELFELLDVLRQVFAPPKLQNTSGEDLYFHEIVWDVSRCAAGGEAIEAGVGARLIEAGLKEVEPCHWSLTADTPNMKDAVIASLRLDLDAATLRADANSDQRAAKVRALITGALPAASETAATRRSIDQVREMSEAFKDEEDDDDEDDDAGSSTGFDMRSPEIQQLMREMIRSKEAEWLDLSIPALGGRTPRDAVQDPIGREQVRRLLDSFPDPGEDNYTGFSATRLRRLLGLEP